MADWELEDQQAEFTSPQQKIVESPLRYFTCLQEAQSSLEDLGHNIDIRLIPFIKGLIVKKHNDGHGKVIFQKKSLR